MAGLETLLQRYQGELSRLQTLPMPGLMQDLSKPQILPNDSLLEIIDDEEYPFCRYMVTEGTVRPFPVLTVNLKENLKSVLIKAEPAANYKFKVENHIAFYKAKDQKVITHKKVGNVIIFDDLRISGVGTADGDIIQIEFKLYSIDGPNSTLLATKTSPNIQVYNHSQYFPAPCITKLLPNWATVGERRKIDVFGPLFLKKKILECQFLEETGKQFSLLRKAEIQRKRNCFHSFSFTAPDHPQGRVFLRSRYVNRDFGTGKPFFYLVPPTSGKLPRERVITSGEFRKNADGGFTHHSSFRPLNESSGTDSLGFFQVLGDSYDGNYQSLSKLMKNAVARECVNKRDVNGCTALFWACYRGHEKCAKLLLVCKANPNCASSRGQTPLHAATLSKSDKIVKELLKYHAKPEAADHEGCTALHLACATGATKCANILMKQMEDLDMIDNDKMTPLHYAAMTQSEETFLSIAEESAARGEELDMVDSNGLTPLHWASASGSSRVVEFLCKQPEVNINAVNFDKQSALFFAVQAGEEKIVRTLLEYKANPNLCDTLKETPLFTAVREGNDNIVGMLMDNKADMSVTNVFGLNPMEAAEKKAVTAPVQKKKPVVQEFKTSKKSEESPRSGKYEVTTGPVLLRDTDDSPIDEETLEFIEGQLQPQTGNADMAPHKKEVMNKQSSMVVKYLKRLESRFNEEQAANKKNKERIGRQDMVIDEQKRQIKILEARMSDLTNSIAVLRAHIGLKS
eukprot:CAMPEP_0168531980 /NCGR_PEP_ID=MMETSP0405-20121227/15875_1 /TAXON_ID=498012 /ORGANISM="Trichosphaerium sp, Strain Am-I-7 wt" /LENGTH=741 /DNA_ID=CAMNT_0008557095 /DNA_START=179 /DNA_END=2404 /DNA_ORIENTATION=+